MKELAFLSKALKRFVGARTLHFQTARNEWQMLVDVPILMCKNKEPGHGTMLLELLCHKFTRSQLNKHAFRITDNNSVAKKYAKKPLP